MGNQGNVGTGIFYEFSHKKAEEILLSLIKNKEIKRKIRLGKDADVQIELETGERFLLKRYSGACRGFRFEKLYISNNVPKETVNWVLLPYLINNGTAEFFNE